MGYSLTERLVRVGMPTEQAKLLEEALAPVTSVNGETGVVVLDAADVGAVPAEEAAAYSETGANLAAVLVAHGMMESDD